MEEEDLEVSMMVGVTVEDTVKTTVGTEGGSTEVDTLMGANCKLNESEAAAFVTYVMGVLRSEVSDPARLLRSETSLREYFLLMIIHLMRWFYSRNGEDKGARVDISCVWLTRWTLFMFSTKTHTLELVERVWGSNPRIRDALGGDMKKSSGGSCPWVPLDATYSAYGLKRETLSPSHAKSSSSFSEAHCNVPF